MKCLVAFAALAVLAVEGQRLAPQTEQYGPPAPYQYSYQTQDVEGSSSAEQSTDGSGRVQGSYTLNHVDGRQRTVTYYADETGFHADVVTNELGTESKDPADVTIRSSAPTGAEAALSYAASRKRA